MAKKLSEEEFNLYEKKELLKHIPTKSYVTLRLNKADNVLGVTGRKIVVSEYDLSLEQLKEELSKLYGG